MKTLDIYIRVSQVAGRGGDSFQSPGDQERVTRQALEWKGWQAGEVNDTDLDKSGGTVDRPGFQRALARIEAGQSDGIAVIKADRFARNARLGLGYVERIQDAGAVFFSATENVDLLSPDGKFQFTILLAIAERERDLHTAQWRRSQTNAAERGIHIGPTPTGYVRAGMKNGKPAGPLVPDPAVAPHIVYVFDAHAQGVPLTELARYLTENVPNRRGARWTPTSVRRLVANRAYRGEVRRKAKAKGTPELLNANAHEPLVTEAQWQAAQRARGVAQTKTHDFLLTGFARCAGCGYMMRPQPQKGHRYYRCGSYDRGAECVERAGVRAGSLEDYVTLHAFARHDVELEDAGGVVDVEEPMRALREAEDAYATIARMAAESARPDLMESAIKQAEQRVLDAEKKKAHAEASNVRDGMPGLGLFRVRDEWPDWTLDQRRRALAALVDCVAVRGLVRDHRPLEARVLVFWRGTAPEGLPVRGKFVTPRPIEWPENVSGVPLAEDLSRDTL